MLFKKVFKSVVSGLLLLAILVSSVPVFAIEQQSNTEEQYDESKTEVEQNQGNEATPTRIFECTVDLKELYKYNPYVWVYSNGDGTDTVEVYDFPVKYVDKNGNFKKKSTIITEVSDGIENDDAKYVTRDNDILTYFSEEVTGGITIEYGDVSIRTVPKIKGKKDAVLSEDSEKVSYQIDDKTTYEYELTYMGYKESIVVSEYTGQTSYDFDIYTNGLELTELDGVLSFVDSEGTVRATMGDLIIFTADEKNNCFGEITYKTVQEGKRYMPDALLWNNIFPEQN